MIESLDTIITVVWTVAMVGAGIYLYFFYFRRFHTSEPNEWMLIVRDGRVIESGVGISGFAKYSDTVVKFPSKINKVKFTAQQVTKEIQGIEISGVIIWTIYREKDGPFKAFKYLGEDIKNNDPRTANENLVEMANAIVRHRIANSTIDEILKNRNEVRDEIRKEMNSIINGWGVWLESVEITDVKILSSTLFTNLQMEFREVQRQKAELIKMSTDRDLKERSIAQDLEFAKKEVENDSKQKIYKANETLKVTRDSQKIYIQQQEIEKKKAEAANSVKIHKATTQNQYNLKIRQQMHETELRQIGLEVEQEKEQQKVTRVKEETNIKKLEEQLANDRIKADYEREAEKKTLGMRKSLIEQVDFRIHALDVMRDVYKSLPIHEMKVFNFGDGQRDPVAGIISQVIGSVNNIQKEIKTA
jgi:flotillin